jgi:hypothetical protein
MPNCVTYLRNLSQNHSINLSTVITLPNTTNNFLNSLLAFISNGVMLTLYIKNNIAKTSTGPRTTLTYFYANLVVPRL